LAASASATVSYPEASLRIGRKQLPSRWLLESASHHERATVDAEAFGAIRARPWLVRQISMSARLASGLPFLTDTEFDLADIRHGAGIGAVAGRNTSFAAGLELARGRRSSQLTRYDGVAGTAGREMFPDRVSPTRLERWARCPFQYFAGDVLRVAEFDEPEEVRVLSALDRGTIIHDALDAFYRESADRPAGPWTDHERARLSDLALARCSSFEQLGRTGHGALWNIERARILSDLADFLDADEARSAELGTRFYAGELAFGDAGGGLPAASIELPDGRAVEFRGRIDRVDRIGDTDEYWVYDYKTGSSYGMNRLDADPLLGGQRLQLPIYGEAVRAALGAKGVRAGYWFVSATQGFRLREVPLDEATRSQLRATLATIREGIAAGMFVAHPGSGNGNCTYCPYDSLCVTDRERSFRRKSDDDAMAPYLALSEPPA
jgi:RecB family exonuclease